MQIRFINISSPTHLKSLPIPRRPRHHLLSSRQNPPNMFIQTVISLSLLCILPSSIAAPFGNALDINRQAAESSEANCCSLDRDKLEAMRGKCPTSMVSLPLTGTILPGTMNKCKRCPPGSCRIHEESFSISRCVCGESFLDEEYRHEECVASFGKAWPESVGKKDLDYRSCSADASPPPPSSLSCCALSTEKLNTLRGTSHSCPSHSFSLSLGSKCERCPSGMCRRGDRCYCPGAFLKSSFWQEECTKSFGKAWPESIDQEDIDHRSCAADAKPPPPSSTSCCELSSEQLSGLRGTSSDCPDFVEIPLSSKCSRCPSGMCRMNTNCVCPGHFLDMRARFSDCEKSHGEKWPSSIEQKDMDFRSCASDAPAVTESGASCCSMTEEELKALRGLSDQCPSSRNWPGSAFDKCGKCSPGMCRMDSVCICPHDFVSSLRLQGKCLASFGKAWPDSITAEEEEWKSCGAQAKPVIGKPGSKPSASPSASVESIASSELANSPTEATRAPVSPSKSAEPSTSSTSASKGDDDDESGGGLTTAQIAGISSGTIGTVLIAVLVVFWLRSHNE